MSRAKKFLIAFAITVAATAGAAAPALADNHGTGTATTQDNHGTIVTPQGDGTV